MSSEKKICAREGCDEEVVFNPNNRKKKFCSVLCANRSPDKHKKKKECPECNRHIRLSNFDRHYNICITPPLKKEKISPYEQINNKYKCPHCYKLFTKQGIGIHIWRAHTEEGQEHKNKTGRAFSDEEKQKISEHNRLHPRGVALHPELRKSKKIPYFDSYERPCVLDSTWEWFLANELDKHNIKWKRPDPFILKSKKTYTPDFFLVDSNTFIDPKAYEWRGEQKEKIEDFQKEYKTKCFVLTKEEDLTWNYIKSLL